jgi:glycosyltransferase involved in cell wall biosynthesis
MNTVYLTNIPSPYRESFHELMSNKLDKRYSVIYCSKIEPNRKWKFQLGNYKKIFLNIKPLNFQKRYIYFDFKIIITLNKIKPEVLILNGLTPVMILAFIWAKIFNCKVIASTDGSILTEKKQGLNFLQILIRKVIYPNCDAYVGASNKTNSLFKSYNSKTNKKFFTSYYSYLTPTKKNIVPIQNRKYDIILCGQFIERKKFDFSLKVIEKLFYKNKNLKIKIVGSGPLKNRIISKIKKIGVNYCYRGFVNSNKIIKEFSSAKLFFFPTSSDGWGVVANESCLAGTPVITCNKAGAANELILNNINGFVINLNTNLWFEKISRLLRNRSKLNLFSQNAYKRVKKFDSDTSTNNTIKAINVANLR